MNWNVCATRLALVTTLLVVSAAIPVVVHAARPNVVIVLSDDQGYGDFAATAIRSSRRRTSTGWPSRASG